MIKSLITESAKKLNFIPAKNGISLYYSSRMIQHYQNLGYCAWHHCQFALNAYVHAPEKPVFPNHTNAQCSLDCIFYATMTMRKEFMSYNTSQLIPLSLDVQLLPYHLLLWQS